MENSKLGGEKIMDRWFNSKWFVRVISLALAVTLYIFVAVESDTKTEEDSRIFPGATKEVQLLDDVPVDIRIDAENYVVSGVPEVVSISLEGKTSTLTPIVRQRNFTVFVDLTDLDEGEHTVEIEHENVPDDLSIYIEPKTITVTIEKRATKELSINLDFINEDELPVGYELGQPEVNPNTVTVISSQSVIDQIAMVKVFIDVAGVTESIKNREVPVNIYDSQGNELNVKAEPENVIVSVPVDNPSKTVPLKVATKGKPPKGFKLTSIKTDIEEVKIYGTRAVLDEIKEISTEEIDLSKIKKSEKIEVPLELPDNIAVDEEKIEVSIELEQTKKFDDIAIDIKGLGNRNIMVVKPKNSKVEVVVVGDEKNVRKLKSKDLSATINVKGLESGKHEIPVSIEGPNNLTIGSEPEQVVVEIE